jgi:histidine triad (HIT) family protein
VDCLFCEILAGRIPATIVREDDRTVAFMDIFPATRGHCLVIPRTHAADLLAIDPADLTACVVAAQDLAGRAVDGLGAVGVNLINSCRPGAWQTVLHFHLHVIPRYEADGMVLPWTPAAADPDALRDAAAILRG